ncbi:MAG TPA: phosphotransferase [Candidatus Saccharimonadia bacterium]|nr:phosphotransferase [Candidatus Saccharimonadia bacterium]
MTTPDAVTRVLRFTGIEPTQIATRQTGYRNHSYRATLADGRFVNLIMYKREPGIIGRIRRANAVSDFLAARGMPTRVTLSPAVIRLHASTYSRYAALYSYLPGMTIPWEAYTHRHLTLLGETMSNMHAQLAAFPNSSLISEASNAVTEHRLLVERMSRYFKEGGVTRSARNRLGLAIKPSLFTRFDTVLSATDRLQHQQALHMDFVRGNLLFDTRDGNLVVSGILDFEKTSFGHPILDVARTLAFLLVDSKYKTEVHVRKYFLQSGYGKRGQHPFKAIRITQGNHTLNLLDELTNMFLFHDFYKFLRHNPYESLQANEHYVRTFQYLSRRGLLTQLR